MRTVAFQLRGQKIKIPFKPSQFTWYDSEYGPGTLKWLCRVTARRRMSVRSIARELDISFQRVSEFYRLYVKKHIPESLQVKSVVKRSKQKSLKMPKKLVPLSMIVLRHGLVARPIECREGAFRRKISINGKICRVIFITPNNPGGYATSLVSRKMLEDCDFFITVLRMDNHSRVYYVTPVSVLKQIMNGRAAMTLCFPTRPHLIRGPRQRISLNEYRNAWHLFKSR